MTRGGVLERTLASIPPPDLEAAAETARLLDAKTKPPGSLGRLETLAIELAGIRGEPVSSIDRPAVAVFAGDHGVTAQAVSPYPSEVTRQMVANFEGGGAAVSVLARQAGARVVVVDAGVGNPTGNIAVGPALSRSETEQLVARVGSKSIIKR